jgi:hypothetical protein
MIPICRCCQDHAEELTSAERVINCVECGEPCSCEGCIADAWEAGQDKLDAEREASMEGGE